MSQSSEEKAAALFLSGLQSSGLARTAYTGKGAKIKVDNVEDSLKGDYTTEDAWAELGGNREAQQFDMKMLALTNPAEYATMRAAALGQVKKTTEASYSTAYGQFVEAGFSREEAKQMALKTASVTKSVQEQAMNKKFGGLDSVFMGTVAREHAPSHVRTHASSDKKRRRKKH